MQVAEHADSVAPGPGSIRANDLRRILRKRRSDLFSLGVVLFEMLTGDTPFKSDSPFELMTKVVEARVPDIKAPNPNVDDGVRQILAKMIAKRPRLRYQNCNELIGDIEDYQAGRVPRWARNMLLESEPVDQSAAPTDVSQGDAATTPVAPMEMAPEATGAPPTERTVSIASGPGVACAAAMARAEPGRPAPGADRKSLLRPKRRLDRRTMGSN